MRFLFILAMILFVSCEQNTIKDNFATINSSLVSAPLQIEYAENLQLEINGDDFKVTVFDPNTGNTDKVFIVKRSKPLKLISLTSTVNGMLSILESTDQLTGISGIDYVYDPAIRELYSQGKIEEFGDEGNLSLEQIIGSKANSILYSGFGREFPDHEKLEKLGFILIPIYDWRENHPLGKAEWIKLIGVLTGKEKEAIAYFNEVKKEYFETKALVSEPSEKPSVISGNLIGDVWYAPGGDSYMAQLMKDAGGSYIYSSQKGTASLEFSIEQILKDNQTTKIWINPGIGNKSKIDKINPHAKFLKAYNNIFCYSPQMNKFWERSAAEPHKVLSDLIHIFHPEIKGIKSYYFYKKID